MGCTVQRRRSAAAGAGDDALRAARWSTFRRQARRGAAVFDRRLITADRPRVAALIEARVDWRP